jgi:hypothetical protein
MQAVIHKFLRRFKWAMVVGLLAVAIPSNSCGPFFTNMVFVRQPVPDDVAGFLNGNLGVIQSTYITRFLALSYRMLSGPPLTAQEKQTTLKGWESQSIYLDSPSGDPQVPAQTAMASAIDSWKHERAAVEPALSDVKVDTVQTVPGQQYEDYDNCLADAFANAARTLTARAREHAAEKAQLAEWINGQDAVFTNCGGSGAMPTAVSQPVWLAQDRAYQTAAAHFYRSEFAPAQDMFAQIAADPNSPWRGLAGYMVGRCLLRSASLPATDKINQDLLNQAAAQFRKVAASGGPYAAAAGELLNMVELRTNPGVAAARLGNAISQPDKYLEQNLQDLAYVHDNSTLDAHIDDARKSDLVDWIYAMQGLGAVPPGTVLPKDPQASIRILDKLRYGHMVERWHTTGNVAWLVAAVSKMDSPDPDLLKAAAAVPPTSPAFVSLTYYRLGTLAPGAASRAEVETALAQLKQAHASTNTINLFTILARKKAESLGQFARLAPMVPAGEDDDGYGPLPAAGVPPSPQKQMTMAGLPVNVAGVERIDQETAMTLNRQIPLTDLVTLVLESKWTKQLRFELAMAVWTRAVLLDQPDQARRMTALMIDSEPGWKPWLTAYDAATAPDERQVTALLALMRFPSVRPYINAGAGRDEGFVAYSSLRDNWWCAGMGGDDFSTSTNYGGAYEDPNQPHPVPAAPSFVTPAMQTQAKTEQDALAKIGDAPQYFGSQAHAWVNAHPKDPRAPEVLGFAFRAMRNGCNLEKAYTLRRDVFALLHKNYPTSTWAKTYAQFEAPE